MSDDHVPRFGRGLLRQALAQRLRERLADRGGTAEPGAWRARSMRALQVPAGVECLSDLAYGDHERHRLDVYRPPREDADRDPAPILVMAHGGGWARGDKTHAPSIAHKLEHWSVAGWIVVSVNYRFIPDANPREQAQDLGCALAYVQRNASSWGGDAARLVLMGHSAGAHLAALISVDARLRTQAGAQTWCATVALDGAALDVVRLMRAPHLPLFDRAFGDDQALWQAASPTLMLEEAPPMPLLMVCSTPRVDSVAQAEGFVRRVHELGGRAELVQADLTHAQINDLTGAEGPLTKAIDAFMQRCIRRA
jgi:arylformamidase